MAVADSKVTGNDEMRDAMHKMGTRCYVRRLDLRGVNAMGDARSEMIQCGEMTQQVAMCLVLSLGAETEIGNTVPLMLCNVLYYAFKEVRQEGQDLHMCSRGFACVQ